MREHDPTPARRVSIARMLLHAPSPKCISQIGTLLGVVIACTGFVRAETISPRRLLEVVDLGNPVISPDGRSVAFRTEQASVERNTYDTVWYVQDLDGNQPPHRVAEGGAPLRDYATGIPSKAPAIWSPDGRWVYYRAQIDGRVGLWRAAADGSGAREIASDPADVRGFVLSADGRTVWYRVGATREQVLDAEQAEYERGIRIDETVQIGAGLFRSSNLEGRLATHRYQGGWFLAGPLLAEAEDQWRAVDTVSLRKRVQSQAEARMPASDAIDLPRSAPNAWTHVVHPTDGRVALIANVPEGDRTTERATMEILVLSSPQATRGVKCVDESCTSKSISSIQWRPNSDDLLFTVQDYDEGRAQSIFLWDVSTGSVRPVVRTAGQISGGQRDWDMPCGLSHERLVCVSAEADRPPRLESIDLSTGNRQVLFDPNQALAADLAATAPAKLFRWTDVQGREYTGQLFEARTAPGARPPPLFVTLYTCDGFLRGGLGDEWPLASLAEQGITSLCANGTPTVYSNKMDRYNEGPLAVAGAAKKLADEGRIDSSRIGMGGLSFGGETALWTLMHSTLLRAVSLASPAATPTYYLANSLRKDFREGLMKNWALGAPDETPERWREISPVYNLDKIQAPVLFQIPEQEYVLTLDYTVPLVRAGRADMYVFPHEPHIKFQPKHKAAVYERNVDWFRFWLQGYEDPNPAKAGQYGVWRAMRGAKTQP